MILPSATWSFYPLMMQEGAIWIGRRKDSVGTKEKRTCTGGTGTLRVGGCHSDELKSDEP